MSTVMENQLAVSQSLIRCFRSVFESSSKSRKETVIKMIATNLTYDDPGKCGNLLSVSKTAQTMKKLSLKKIIHRDQIFLRPCINCSHNCKRV